MINFDGSTIASPLDATQMGFNTIQAPKTKRQHRSAGTDSVCELVQMIFVDPDELGPQTRAIGKVFLLAFCTYLEHPNLSPYATWASILVLTAPRLQNGLEVESV